LSRVVIVRIVLSLYPEALPRQFRHRALRGWAVAFIGRGVSPAAVEEGFLTENVENNKKVKENDTTQLDTTRHDTTRDDTHTHTHTHRRHGHTQQKRRKR